MEQPQHGEEYVWVTWNQMYDLGLRHHDIAQRARNVNQATTYRVVEGDTQNPPKLHYQYHWGNESNWCRCTYFVSKIGHTMPYQERLCLQKAHQTSPLQNRSQKFSHRGELQAASRYVMVMFDLAQSDDDPLHMNKLNCIHGVGTMGGSKSILKQPMHISRII